MRLQFIGCGDAFGSGGRLNTCIHVRSEAGCFLIDCGATSLVGLKSNRIDPNEIDTVFITHFHADHFGGIPFFILDAQFFAKRTEPLTLVGPKGLEVRFKTVMETAFPGSSGIKRRFKIMFVELEDRQTGEINGVSATAYRVVHGDPGGSCFAYRLEHKGRVIAYTGDTEWTDALVDAGREADLLIAESYFYGKRVKLHLDYQTLSEHLPAIAAKKVVLTHMSEEMLASIDRVTCEIAEDGKVFNI